MQFLPIKRVPRNVRIVACLPVLFGTPGTLKGQGTRLSEPDPGRWEQVIRRFEAWDSKSSFPPDAVLFVGSSSIRLWPTRESFPDRQVINRGFGGAHISDVNHFARRIVLPYRPRVIVFYAGDNDIAGGKSPQRVFDDYRAFVCMVHDAVPNARVLFLPIKPSPSRWSWWPQMREANSMIQAYSQEDDRLLFVDTATPMLGGDGRPRAELFLTDGLHLNAQGYELWTRVLAPAIEQASAPVRPAALRKGDTIAFVAPAGRLDRARMERARERLEAMGFTVKVPDNLYRTRGYLAGEDEARAAELMAAFRDPEVRAVFPGTGNYGTTRVLDRLDYESIRRNPKILIGFSDITGLHLAIQKRAGLVTFHSPNPMWGLGSEGNLSGFSAKYFWRALLGTDDLEAETAPHDEGYTFDLPIDVPQIKVLSPGTGRGRLTGGNLSLVAALMGTDYEIETEGRVLFLEDVGERPYRIDRCLSQLRLAGKLDHPAAVILGQFSKCEPKPDEESLTLEQVFEDYFGELGIPVITNFPAGHHKFNATLPLGAQVEVDADRSRVSVLENPVTLRTAQVHGLRPEVAWRE